MRAIEFYVGLESVAFGVQDTGNKYRISQYMVLLTHNPFPNR
jgi:hypothetical protein